MWKKHLERDDSIIVGEESHSSQIHPLFLSPSKQTADHSGPYRSVLRPAAELTALLSLLSLLQHV